MCRRVGPRDADELRPSRIDGRGSILKHQVSLIKLRSMADLSGGQGRPTRTVPELCALSPGFCKLLSATFLTPSDDPSLVENVVGSLSEEEVNCTEPDSQPASLCTRPALFRRMSGCAFRLSGSFSGGEVDEGFAEEAWWWLSLELESDRSWRL